MKRYIVSDDRQLTDEEMEQELRTHFDDINKRIETFNTGKRSNKSSQLDIDPYNHIERYSIEWFVRNYIRWFNQNVRDYGYGFETDWDEDDTLSIRYKNGKIRTISTLDDDGTKKISVDNIDSIILNGSWGYAFAGPHVVIYNYREHVKYRPEDKWGYKSVLDRYKDDDDIRLDFT